MLVMPLSVLNSWKQDTQRFFPSFDVYIHHNQDAAVREDNFAAWKKSIPNATHGRSSTPVRLCMTTYEMAMIDNKLFSRSKLFLNGYLVIDEAHRLKNRASKLCHRIEKISTFGRVLLTGTPLQNNLGMMFFITKSRM